MTAYPATGKRWQRGEVIAGKYRVESLLGEGGMGAVYAAHHELLDQEVAVKLLNGAAAHAGDARERFLREGRAAARLKSAHVARVTDVGELPSGELFLVMERLHGEDLGKAIERRGPLPVAEAVDAVLQSLDALAEAHANGVVHRDLKPANLFLSTEGASMVVKVLDFGISKSAATHDRGALTSTASILGSPSYMAPEQVRSSKRVDHRADIWSLGVVLYEALTAKAPFEADSLGGVLANILEQPAPALSAQRPDAPRGLADVIARCLAKSPADRFASCGELAVALAPFGSGKHSACVARAQGFRPAEALGAAVPVAAPSAPSAPSAPGSASDSTLAHAATQESWATQDGASRAHASARKRSSFVVAAAVGGAIALACGLTVIVTLRFSAARGAHDGEGAQPAVAAVADSTAAAPTATTAPSATATTTATAAATAAGPAATTSTAAATASAVRPSTRRPTGHGHAASSASASARPATSAPTPPGLEDTSSSRN